MACVSEPPRAMSRPATPTLVQYGSTTSDSPSASITSIMSTAPPPKPPCSSAKGIPSRPISAKAAHVFSLYPMVDATTRVRASNE